MAAKGSNQKNRKVSSMTTKNGKPRLGTLNVEQLEKLLTNARKKEAPKIKNALARRLVTQQVSKKIVEVVEEVSVEAVVES